MTVINFPKPVRERVEVIAGTCVETGKPIYLFEWIEGEARVIIAEHHDMTAVAKEAAGLLSEGTDVVWETA